MRYEEWKREALDDPENDLSRLVEWFRAHDEDVVHLDRHVWEPLERPMPHLEDIESRMAICMVAIELLRRWSELRKAARDADIILSRPVLVIDDDWTDDTENATPPHVYVCMAKTEGSFAPVRRDEAKLWTSPGDMRLGTILPSDATLLRIDGAFDDEPGAWLVEFR